MSQTSVLRRAGDKATDDEAIRPFQIDTPEGELTELRRRLDATRNGKRSKTDRRACSSRCCRSSHSIGRRIMTGANARPD